VLLGEVSATNLPRSRIERLVNEANEAVDLQGLPGEAPGGPLFTLADEGDALKPGLRAIPSSGLLSATPTEQAGACQRGRPFFIAFLP
jgi:hypothetical protein